MGNGIKRPLGKSIVSSLFFWLISSSGLLPSVSVQEDLQAHLNDFSFITTFINAKNIH